MDSVRVDARLTIRYESPALEEVVTDDDSGGGIFDENAQLVYKAPKSQTYIIEANASSYRGDTGAYYISVNPAKADATPTEARFSRSFIASEYGSLTSYESDDYAFRILYPANWQSSYECGGQAVACFVIEDAGLLAIIEEDTTEFQKDGMSLNEYVDVLVDVLEFSAPDFKLLSREETKTAQGLISEIMTFEMLNGRFKGIRLTYMNEDHVGFSASYVIQGEMYEQVIDLFEHSLNTFRELDPETQDEDPIYHYDEGLKLATAEKFDEAIAAYTEAVDFKSRPC